jgi:hypothetical protein
MKHNPIPASEVLAWLLEHHPELHQVAELDRSWCWLSVDLRGDHNKATREAIKQYGFAYKRNGVHILPSGKGGTWSNSCNAPLRFSKRGGGSRGHKNAPTNSPLHNKQVSALRADPLADAMALDEIAAAFA